MPDETVTQKHLSGCKPAIRRRGRLVCISLESASEYIAIELFDRLVESVKSGTLKLDFALPKETVYCRRKLPHQRCSRASVMSDRPARLLPVAPSIGATVAIERRLARAELSAQHLGRGDH